MKTLLRLICWIFGHKHTQLKKIKHGSDVLIYGHGDPNKCLRCGKKTPQLLYFSNILDEINSFAAVEINHEKLDS